MLAAVLGFPPPPSQPTTPLEIRAKVLDAMKCFNSKRVYARGLDAFFAWRSEVGSSPLNKATVQSFRSALQKRGLSSSTIGVYLAAVRRFAAVAAEYGLLQPEIADSISRVPGVNSKSVRPQTWLTADEAGLLLRTPDCSTLKGCRDRALFVLLIGCALDRIELTRLFISSFEIREGRWVLPDIVGKGGRLRTVPVPDWVKHLIDAWTSKAAITEGPIFRHVNKGGGLSGKGISGDAVWAMTREYGAQIGKPNLSPHDLRRTCARLCRASGAALEQIQLLLGHASVQTTERYIGTLQELASTVNDNLPIALAGTFSELLRKGPHRARPDRFAVAIPDGPVSSAGARGSR